MSRAPEEGVLHLAVDHRVLRGQLFQDPVLQLEGAVLHHQLPLRSTTTNWYWGSREFWMFPKRSMSICTRHKAVAVELFNVEVLPADAVKARGPFPEAGGSPPG